MKGGVAPGIARGVAHQAASEIVLHFLLKSTKTINNLNPSFFFRYFGAMVVWQSCRRLNGTHFSLDACCSPLRSRTFSHARWFRWCLSSLVSTLSLFRPCSLYVPVSCCCLMPFLSSCLSPLLSFPLSDFYASPPSIFHSICRIFNVFVVFRPLFM